MRRFSTVAIASAIAVAALAVPASGASFDHHFSVISKDVSHKSTNHSFEFKSVLLNKFDRNDKVGVARGKCKFNKGDHKGRCKVLIRLNGKVGGSGQLFVKGNIGRHDNTLLVRNGSGDFNGVAGKLSVHTVNKVKDKITFALVR
jgi:hypothetical protein